MSVTCVPMYRTDNTIYQMFSGGGGLFLATHFRNYQILKDKRV